MHHVHVWHERFLSVSSLGLALGGTLLTSIVLGAVVLQTYITASLYIEACARAQALELLNADGVPCFVSHDGTV
jgi:hypothetical protein